MKTHIRRKHVGTQEFPPAVYNKSTESNFRATTPGIDETYVTETPGLHEFEDNNNNYSSFLDQILPQMRKLKEFKQLSSDLNNSSSLIGSNLLQEISEAIYNSPAMNPNSFSPKQQVEPPAMNPNSFSPKQQVEPPAMNPNSFSPKQQVEPPGSGSTLGYEAFVCERCLRVALQEVQDNIPRRSIKLNHLCYEQIAIESRLKNDFSKEIMTRKQFLIDCLAAIVISTSHYHEKAKLIAVEVPGSGLGLDEEFIDLDPLKRDVPSWAYHVAQIGETIVDKVELQKYLEMFGSTFAFFPLTIYEKPKFYFVYISNGLKPQHLRYITRLLEPRPRNDFYSTSNLSLRDRPQSTKLSNMIKFVRVGKDSIPVFNLGPTQFYQTIVSSQHHL